MGRTRNIEVDEATAETLQTRAEERGVSVARVVAELVTSDEALLAMERDELVELDRRWAKVAAGDATVPHADVVRWLETWGTAAYRSWHER
jgi:predicted transcriptional regulator